MGQVLAIQGGPSKTQLTDAASQKKSVKFHTLMATVGDVYVDNIKVEPEDDDTSFSFEGNATLRRRSVPVKGRYNADDQTGEIEFDFTK